MGYANPGNEEEVGASRWVEVEVWKHRVVCLWAYTATYDGGKEEEEEKDDDDSGDKKLRNKDEDCEYKNKHEEKILKKDKQNMNNKIPKNSYVKSQLNYLLPKKFIYSITSFDDFQFLSVASRLWNVSSSYTSCVMKSTWVTWNLNTFIGASK